MEERLLERWKDPFVVLYIISRIGDFDDVNLFLNEEQETITVVHKGELIVTYGEDRDRVYFHPPGTSIN